MKLEGIFTDWLKPFPLKKISPWWIVGGVILLVLVLIAVIVIVVI
ncbi:hypothetical protein J2Z49_002101 [Desulfofundulus luciae]|uniref:Uncharacterized protein n=1 Tax=Desulfofundulus luciae TaxID=74702 RepID=A0ABU0B2M8_9FIRM|nr:hypothetical protein [Desulfofundulus luciae]MDQ0286984.1 hypothetical protein [Desulfofundulus luciae]